MRLKRVFDIVASSAGLVILSPVFLTAAAGSALRFRTSPFYRTGRIGKDLKPFDMIKFRSLTDEKGPDGALLPEDQRMTRYGRFLRITAVDELPQLWNILKGDMSFVGPRPRSGTRPSDYVPHSHRAIFSVRPGLTGPWQVASIGREEKMGLGERLQLDLSYVRQNPSLWGDIKLMAQTLPAVVRGHDGEVFSPSAPAKTPVPE